jgi:ATP-dependent DNA ligase
LPSPADRPSSGLIAAAVDALEVRSCLLDSEAVACDGDGMPAFDRLRYRRADGAVSCLPSTCSSWGSDLHG